MEFVKFGSILKPLWPLAMDLWEAWGIQLLVLVSCFFQIALVTLGGRRRYSLNLCTRFTIWSSYLLASSIASFALGKLTVVSIRDPDNPDYNVGLKGLLAPLLLLHLANPDCISAYSVEDSILGVRYVVNLAVTTGFVIWILIRCWDSSSPVRWLYFPLLITGVMKSVGKVVLALQSMYDDKERVYWDESYISSLRDGSPVASDFLKKILMAYKRFDVLRPHQENWVYTPRYIRNTWISIDSLTPMEAFTVTEIELGFVFDMLYSKAPIRYTTIGIVSSAISLLCLVSTLCGFIVIFRSTFLLDLHVTYTCALLMVSTIVELYQIYLLPFSHWAVVKISESRLVNENLLVLLVEICKKQRSWSDSMQQFNLVEYCLSDDCSWPVNFILSLLHIEERFKRYRRSTQKTISQELKVEVLKTMRVLKGVQKDKKASNGVEKSKQQLSTSRGFLTLEHFRDKLKQDALSEMERSFSREFSKSIIIWHIATDILLLRSTNCSSSSCGYRYVSQLLSNYMMYLLARRPHMLTPITSDVALRYVSSVLKNFSRLRGLSSQEKILSKIEDLPPGVERALDGTPITTITKGWKALDEVNFLVNHLEKVECKWEVIKSAWVEMLCFAAHHCRVNDHTRMLRKGGEFITHVWLLLAHDTNKQFNTLDNEVI